MRKEFALKTLNPMNMTQTTVLRLQKESQAASKVEHPNLVRAIDFGLINGVQPFFVMELIQGPTLQQYLKSNGKMELKQALDLFIKLALAIDAAHQKGVIHRDLKPGNVMLAAGGNGSLDSIPKIVDFGIAKFRLSQQSPAMSLTTTGEVFGTPLYMSPEQCAGLPVDERTDIYALGCMLFEALTGAPPFNGRNPLEIMRQHDIAPLPSLKEVSMGAEFPPALEVLIAKMLAKRSIDRYANCQQVAEELSKIQRGASSVSAKKGFRRGLSVRTIQIIGSIIGVICSLSIGYGIGMWKSLADFPVKNAPPQILTSTPNEEVQYNSFSYFAQGKRDQDREFHFPKLTKGTLGRLSWWDHERCQSVIAAGAQHVPAGKKLIFAAETPMEFAPQLWASFHRNDLYGVLFLGRNLESNEEPVEQSISFALQQSKLGLLKLQDNNLPGEVFRKIGGSETLKWLELEKITIDGQPLTGEHVCSLSNLKNLRILKIYALVSPTPLLKKLSDIDGLTRLCLRDANLEKQDSQLLGRIKSLEVLCVLGKQAMDPDELLTAVAHLPKLRYLCIDAAMVVRSVMNNKVNVGRKFAGLTMVLYGPARGREGFIALWCRRLSELFGCSVTYEEDLKTIYNKRFDPLKEDPEKLGVW
jgi:serine/threonine protein kinase